MPPDSLTVLVRVVAVLLLVVLSATSGSGVGVPPLDLEKLLESSDLVVVGRVLSVSASGPAMAQVRGYTMLAQTITASLEVRYTLKGAPHNQVSFSYILPSTFVGYRGVPVGKNRVIFLKSGPDGYVLANPFYPSLPATMTLMPTGGPLFDEVLSQVAKVITTPDAPRDDRREAIRATYGVQSETLRVALRSALDDPDQEFRLLAATELLLRNDLQALPIAVDALNAKEAPEDVLNNIRRSLAARFQDERGIPLLTSLLKSPDAQTRRAAIVSLRNTTSTAALPGLSKGLYDADLEVRYFAVVGMAEITNQPEYRPLLKEFQEDEARYLHYWLHWARTR
jgi:hypothetical protein